MNTTDNSSKFDGPDPWMQSLIGAIDLGSEDTKESYINYLEEKYS